MGFTTLVLTSLSITRVYLPLLQGLGPICATASFNAAGPTSPGLNPFREGEASHQPPLNLFPFASSMVTSVPYSNEVSQWMASRPLLSTT